MLLTNPLLLGHRSMIGTHRACPYGFIEGLDDIIKA